MNTKLILVLLFIALCIGGFFIYQYEKKFRANQNELLEEEISILKEISAKTGLPPKWIEIREYIYCSYLQIGMKRSDVEKGLAEIGEIETWDTEISFTNPIIESHLGHLMVYFSSTSPSAALE